MAGPFDYPLFADLRVTLLGLVPKKEPNKFHMVHHLSYLEGLLANDGIDQETHSVTHTSFDAAFMWLRRFCKGALLAKMDIVDCKPSRAGS